MNPSRQCARIPIKLCWSILARGVATSTASASNSSSSRLDSPFPYPVHRNPTPYQIFHLPHNATEPEIKDRYIDLVRLYHPDKAGSSVPSDVTHERFQAITAAYDALRNKAHPGEGAASPLDLRYQTTASWRARQKRSQELYASGAIDEKWKDRIILFGVIATIAIVITQTATTRREAMAEVLARTRRSNLQQEQQRQRKDDRLALSDKH